MSCQGACGVSGGMQAGNVHALTGVMNFQVLG